MEDSIFGILDKNGYESSVVEADKKRIRVYFDKINIEKYEVHSQHTHSIGQGDFCGAYVENNIVVQEEEVELHEPIVLVEQVSRVHTYFEEGRGGAHVDLQDQYWESGSFVNIYIGIQSGLTGFSGVRG